MESVEFCGLKIKLCWAIFIVLNALTLAFMVVTLSVPNWVKMDDSEFDLSFKGSLYGLVETSIVFRKWEDEPYSTAEEDWCDLKDLYSGDNQDFYTAGCTLFGALTMCGITFLGCEMLSACYTIINMLGLCIFFCKLDVIWLSLASVFAACIWHLFGFVAYAIGTSLSFGNKCDDFRDGSEYQSLCADNGPIIAFFLLFFMVTYGILQIVFICFYYKRKKDMGFTWRQSNIKEMDVTVDQDANARA